MHKAAGTDFSISDIKSKDMKIFRHKVLGTLIGGAIFLALTNVPAWAQNPTPVPPKPTPVRRAPSNTNVIFIPFLQISGTVTPPAAPKKGLPLTYNDCASATAVGAKWIHAWSTTPPDCAGMENIPMIWGASDVNATLGGNSQWIIGFNEPDSASQANLSPAVAATLWRQIEQKYPTRKLVAPTPSGAAPNWLVDFRNAYIAAYGAPPRLNALGVHCYSWYAELGDYGCIPHTRKFIDWANAWNVPEVWVTEFSFSPTAPSSLDQSLQEANTYITWMKNQSLVTRYAWFASKIQGTEWWAIPTFHTPITDWNSGALTLFGNMYLPHQ